MNHREIQQEREALETLDENCCEKCGVELGPYQADTSYDVSFNWIEGGKSLCEKHLDEYRRRQDDFLDGL